MKSLLAGHKQQKTRRDDNLCSRTVQKILTRNVFEALYPPRSRVASLQLSLREMENNEKGHETPFQKIF